MSELTQRITCSYCSVGCAFDVTVKDGRTTLKPAADYPVNLGKACPKGFHLLTPFAASDRATAPLLHRGRGEPPQPADWDTALRTFVERFKGIQARHGPESVAFLSTGQIPTEEMALLGALAKFGMGIGHGDGNARQCMATAAVAYKQAFGFDAPPFTYRDFEESDLLVFFGANPGISHPIMWNRVKANPHEPTIVVVDPRRTKTAEQATVHLALRPKSDLTLLYALANVLIENGWIDRKFIAEHTEGFEGFRQHVRRFDLESAARDTGLRAEEIRDLGERIHRARAASFRGAHRSPGLHRGRPDKRDSAAPGGPDIRTQLGGKIDGNHHARGDNPQPGPSTGSAALRHRPGVGGDGMEPGGIADRL